MTPRFRAAVLGFPIAHSRSPQLHLACYSLLNVPECTYERIEVRAGQLKTFLAGLDATWMGFSLTMPLKVEGMALLDAIEPSAARIGAINTMVFRPEGLTGFNTDQLGFRELLRPHLAAGGSAAVIGTGATARSALSAIAAYDPSDVVVIGRDPIQFLDLLERFPEVPLRFVEWPQESVAGPGLRMPVDVVVCTVPKTVSNPVSPLPSQYLIDVNYPDSPNVEKWLAAGGRGEDGVELLVIQGASQVSLMLSRVLLSDSMDELIEVARAAVRQSL